MASQGFQKNKTKQHCKYKWYLCDAKWQVCWFLLTFGIIIFATKRNLDIVIYRYRERNFQKTLVGNDKVSLCLCVCRWRTSPWRSRMAASCATLSTTTTRVSCQKRLSVTAPLRLSSAHQEADWSSAAQPATPTAPLSPCPQAQTVCQLCAATLVQPSVPGGI